MRGKPTSVPAEIQSFEWMATHTFKTSSSSIPSPPRTSAIWRAVQRTPRSLHPERGRHVLHPHRDAKEKHEQEGSYAQDVCRVTHFVIRRSNHLQGISNSDEEHSVMQSVGGMFWELQQDLPLGNVQGGHRAR